MSSVTYFKRFILANLLTLYYNIQVLILFLITYLKNPFSDPWALKLRLEPPPCLTDPKYGVHKYIKVNNVKLHYLESGDPSKPLMIFVHGFPEFWYSWRHQIVEFNKDYWCIAPDLRGYGDSEKPDDVASYDIQLLVDDIRDLIRQLGREKAIIVSHDWGGVISGVIRDFYPDAVAALVLLASTTRESWLHEVWNNTHQRKMSWYIFLYRFPYLPERLMRMNDMAIFNAAMLTKGKSSISAQDIECFKYWFGKPLAFTPPINYYRANFQVAIPEKKKCDRPIPFLVALAEHDKYLNHSLLDSMKNEYTHIETTIVENCSHFMQEEEPERINNLLRDFLKKHEL